VDLGAIVPVVYGDQAGMDRRLPLRQNTEMGGYPIVILETAPPPQPVRTRISGACHASYLVRHTRAEESTLTDERSLLRRARSLDDAALSEIFDTYYPLLYRYIYHHLHHRATAEDLAAEVLTRMLEQLADGRGPTRHLNAWLYRVAHNLVVDESRRRVHRDHDPLDEGTAAAVEDVEAQTAMAIWRQQARGALAELTPNQRAVLFLRFLEGYENKEISRVLQTSVGAVKALQHRALEAMRRHLERAGVTVEEYR
jgi:RNA polymerase sigma-70 factor (ECF subfamily)